MTLAQSADGGRRQVERLVERFDRNRIAYKRPEYKEACVCAEFIDPLFEALGWDVRNTKGYAGQYKDVIHEDALVYELYGLTDEKIAIVEGATT